MVGEGSWHVIHPYVSWSIISSFKPQETWCRKGQETKTPSLSQWSITLKFPHSLTSDLPYIKETHIKNTTHGQIITDIVACFYSSITSPHGRFRRNWCIKRNHQLHISLPTVRYQLEPSSPLLSIRYSWVSSLCFISWVYFFIIWVLLVNTSFIWALLSHKQSLN